MILLGFLFIVKSKIFQGNCSSLHESRMIIEIRQCVNLGNFSLDLLSKILLKDLFVLSLFGFGFDLHVVVVSHVHADFVLVLFEVRSLDVILDDILQSQHVPCIVFLWLDMARCSLLWSSLAVIVLRHLHARLQ